jgi:STE24 endopeptidase
MVQVLLIATFVLLFLRESLARPFFSGQSGANVAAAYVLGLGAVSLAMLAAVWVQGRRLDRTGSTRAVHRADAAVLGSRVAAVVVHGFAVLGLGWLDVVRRWVGDIVLADELLAAAPVLGVFVLGWWAMYPIDRRLREAVVLRELDEGRPIRPMPGRGAYVLNALRHQAALVLVPVVLITGWMEGVGAGVSRLPRMGTPPWLFPVAAQVVGMGLVLTMMPLVLRRVWSTAVLGPGPLRDCLTEMCARQRVRVRELLVWGTHGTMINGAVMGFLGPLRYILLTDALLESLPQRQVEAVMAHELGHV